MDTPMLEARALAKIYTGAPNGGVVALREVSLTVRRGELVMVTGKSGSGKSTLLHLLGCLDRPTAGDVIINGVNSRLFTRDALAHLRSRHIGFVFQDSRLLPHLTVLENVLLPYRLVGERGGHAGIQLSVAALMPKLRRAPAPTPDPPHVSPPSCEIRREVNGEAILLARIVMHPLHKSRAPLTLLLSCLKPSKVDLLDIGR